MANLYWQQCDGGVIPSTPLSPPPIFPIFEESPVLIYCYTKKVFKKPPRTNCREPGGELSKHSATLSHTQPPCSSISSVKEFYSVGRTYHLWECGC